MNKQQKDELLAFVKPGDEIYLNGGDWTATLVDYGQGQIDKTFTAKLTHVVFVDKDNNISESTIEFGFEKTNKFPFFKVGVLKTGIEITPIADWAKDDGNCWPFLIVQRFNGMTQKIIDKATATAYQHKKDGFFYPIRELVGSLIAYWNFNIAGWFSKINPEMVAVWQKQILTRMNPLNSKRAEYCIAYVNDCLKSANFPIIPDSIEQSISNLGSGMRRIDREYDLHFISHPGVKDYHKNAGEEFDPNCIKNWKESNI